jgi:type IV pilus assembly protein PilA
MRLGTTMKPEQLRPGQVLHVDEVQLTVEEVGPEVNGLVPITFKDWKHYGLTVASGLLIPVTAHLPGGGEVDIVDYSLFPSSRDVPRARRLSLLKEEGFTLIELLVVILIIGVLAAIAIPAFLSQTSKANDTAAKTQVGTMQTVMETYANEHSGSFEGATLAELQAIEPTLKDTSSATAQVKSAGVSVYEVESVAGGTGDHYLLKYEEGADTRTCTPTGHGGCPTSGTW